MLLTTTILVLFIGCQLALAQLSGAIWTCDQDGNQVNGNIYDARADVYLNGGPQNNSAGLDPGDYYVQVTTPDGDVLGKSEPKVVTVGDNGIFGPINLFNFLYTTSSDFTERGYDFTTNQGGEYKVWVSQDPNFPNNKSKTDNFKVKESPLPEQPNPAIQVVKTADPATVEPGDTVTYSYTVTNTGNVALSNISLVDDMLGNITLNTGSLAPGASTVGSATYTVPADTSDGATITNVATVTGLYNEQTVSYTDSASVSVDSNGDNDDDDDDNDGGNSVSAVQIKL